MTNAFCCVRRGKITGKWADETRPRHRRGEGQKAAHCANETTPASGTTTGETTAKTRQRTTAKVQGRGNSKPLK